MQKDKIKQVEKPLELVEIALIVKDLSKVLDENGKPIYRDVPGKSIKDFDGLPLYRLVPPNILRKSAVIKRDSHDIFVYDITAAPEELKEKYSSFIVRMDCDIEMSNEVEAERPRISCGRIVELLPLDGIYSSLRPSEKKKLGSEFVAIRNSEDGYTELVVVDIAGEIPDNVYLKIKSGSVGEALRSKISPEVVELISKGNAKFALPEEFGKKKNF